MALLKTEKEIAVLEESGRILARLLREISNRARPGVNLLSLEKFALQFIKERKAIPAFLGYRPEEAARPFPAALCLSLNDTVVHGVPFDYSLVPGDILKIDSGISYQGLYTDSAITVGIKPISKKAERLIVSTKKCLENGILAAKPGGTTGDIGYAIAKQAEKDGFFVLKELTGHGVGYEIHEDPIIWNFGKKGEGDVLSPGMIIAIEPMLSVSCDQIKKNARDDSYASQDGGLTAHFEHTVAITKKGARVLTMV